ncbi:MAG: hypothetical protein PF694_06195 [Bacteroidetes bacterium]|jgi:hypothetical protein|nr:hypothetical protein [Bacteroidota bacterium]
MDIKQEFEGRINKLESLIADKGIGSKQLSKVRNAQRNVNIAVFVGSLITIAGIAVWALRGSSDEE